MVYSILLALSLLLPAAGMAEGESSVVLYQVGAKGKYCLSLTRDTSGCISGEDKGGNSINIVDVTRGKNVRFENLSDAPHDMRISGANKENLPAQGPGAGPVDKLMAREDRNKEKITCSFHGDQLGVGYRVIDDTANSKSAGAGEGHKEPGAPGSQSAVAGNSGDGGGGGADAGGSGYTGVLDPSRPIRNTGLADVAREVLAKGRPDEVQKLVSARPELMADLKEVRPLLADEVAKKIANGETPGDASALAEQEAAKALLEGGAVALDANGNPILSDSGEEDANAVLAAGDGNGLAGNGGAALDEATVSKAADAAFARTRALTAAASKTSLAGLALGGKLGSSAKGRALASVGGPLVVGLPKDDRGFFSVGIERAWKVGKLICLLALLAVVARGFYLVLFGRRKKEDKE